MNDNNAFPRPLDPTTVPPEAYEAWVRTTIDQQDKQLEELFAPLRGLDQDVAVSEQWLEDLARVAHAFVEPDPRQLNREGIFLRA